MKEIIDYINSKDNITLMDVTKFCAENKLWHIVRKNQRLIISLVERKNKK